MPSTIIDVLIDCSERAVDSLIESEALREIPLLKTFLGIKDGWLKVRDHLYEKKVEAFLSGLRTGLEQDEKAINEFMQGSNERRKFAETAFVLIDRYDNVHKPEVMGLLWAACARGRVPYDQVARLCHLIDNIYWDDLLRLLSFKEGVYSPGELGVEALCSAGLLARVGIVGGTFGPTEEGDEHGGHQFAKTHLAHILVSFGLKKITVTG
jgi:hypothetical protein